MNRASQIEAAARVFHKEHPEVWHLFTDYTFERIRKGFRHYSAKSVFERIRWETDSPSYDKRFEFKVNNNFTCVYARWFMEVFPEHEGFFRTRKRWSQFAPPAKGHELGPQDY